MSLEWNSYTIGESCELITGFPFKSKYYLDEGLFKVVRGDNVKEGFIKWDDKKRCWNELNDKLKKVILKEEDIVIGMDGSKLGKNRATISKKDLPALLAQRVACVRAKEGFDQNYIKYVILSNYFKSYVDKVKTGTSIPHISLGQISEFTFEAPDYKKQKTISSILSTIDKKITVNQEINKNLQKQINILFKSFFINFEFYDGKYQETLFGEIPIEWNIILFKDILNERNEKSTNQDIPMYSVTLDGIQPRADIYKKKITAKTTKFKIIHKYDLIFGMPNSGYQYGIMYDEIGGVSSAYPVFEINGIQPRYVDLFIKNISNYFNDIVKSGSRMGQGIDKKVLLSKEIYVPPNEHLDKYYSIESKLLDLINHNLTEINNLTKLRDTLLPKLMSGEIDVSKINCDLE